MIPSCASGTLEDPSQTALDVIKVVQSTEEERI